MPQPYPTTLKLSPEGRLFIGWSDQTLRSYGPGELRKACPCATCREQRGAPEQPAPLFQVLSPAEARPLTVAGMKPVGNYAYSVEFSDGHDTGIFTFEVLRGLGREEQPDAATA